MAGRATVSAALTDERSRDLQRPASSLPGRAEPVCVSAPTDPEHTARGTGAGDNDMPEPTLPEQLEAIARRFLGITTLKTRNNDRDDFHSVAVWSLRAALEAAYELGKQAGAK